MLVGLQTVMFGQNKLRQATIIKLRRYKCVPNCHLRVFIYGLPYGPMSVLLSIHSDWVTVGPWQEAYSCEVKPKAQTSKDDRASRRRATDYCLAELTADKRNGPALGILERFNVETQPFFEVESYRGKPHRWTALSSLLSDQMLTGTLAEGESATWKSC